MLSDLVMGVVILAVIEAISGARQHAIDTIGALEAEESSVSHTNSSMDFDIFSDRKNSLNPLKKKNTLNAQI